MSPPTEPCLPDTGNRQPLLSRRTLLAGTGLAVGIALIGHDVVTARPASAAVPAANGYIYPTDPFTASTEAAGQFGAPRGNGRRHMGLDTWGYRGMPILAIAGGRVVSGDWNSTSGDPHGWGHHVLIDHGNGVSSRYAHFNGAPIVANQSNVSQGQVIGYMGNSQYGPTSSLGVHLHIEIIVHGSFVSPLAFLAGNSNPPLPGTTPAQQKDTDVMYYQAISASSDGVVPNGWMYVNSADGPLRALNSLEGGAVGVLYPQQIAKWAGNNIRALIKIVGLRQQGPSQGIVASIGNVGNDGRLTGTIVY